MSDVQTIATLTEWSTAVRTRDGCCTVCGSTSNLHAHHIKRKSQHPELALDLDNGTTLCNTCHAKEHESDFPNIVAMLENPELRKAGKAASKKRSPPYEIPAEVLSIELKPSLKTLGWSQKQLAARLGYDDTTVSRWATGETPLPLVIKQYLRLLLKARAILYGPDLTPK